MLGFVSTESNTCNGPSRREFLRLGGLAASGVTLSNWFAQQAQAAEESVVDRLAQGCELHPVLDARRAKPHRNLGHEA